MDGYRTELSTVAEFHNYSSDPHPLTGQRVQTYGYNELSPEYKGI